jgi:hypothetical protein
MGKYSKQQFAFVQRLSSEFDFMGEIHYVHVLLIYAGSARVGAEFDGDRTSSRSTVHEFDIIATPHSA